VETLGFLGFLGVGLTGFFVQGHFLHNIFPVEVAEEVPHAGFIFLLNLVIGLKVGAGMTLLCYYLLKDDK
jgi:multicomponent Na+:H+ antiporter subunit B